MLVQKGEGADDQKWKALEMLGKEHPVMQQDTGQIQGRGRNIDTFSFYPCKKREK